jgi:hypothetical protein
MVPAGVGLFESCGKISSILVDSIADPIVHTYIHTYNMYVCMNVCVHIHPGNVCVVCAHIHSLTHVNCDVCVIYCCVYDTYSWGLPTILFTIVKTRRCSQFKSLQTTVGARLTPYFIFVQILTNESIVAVQGHSLHHLIDHFVAILIAIGRCRKRTNQYNTAPINAATTKRRRI